MSPEALVSAYLQSLPREWAWYTPQALVVGFLQFLGVYPRPTLRKSSQGKVWVDYQTEGIALPLGFRAANVDTLRRERARGFGVGGGRYVVYRT